MNQFRHIIPVLLLAVGGNVWAQQPGADPEASGEETLVREDAGQQVEEIRRQGRLDSIVVTPRTGPSYIIEDRGVDGMQSPQEGGDMESGFNIRTWKIGEW